MSRIPRSISKIQSFVPGTFRYGTQQDYVTVEITATPRQYTIISPHGYAKTCGADTLEATLTFIPWDLMPEESTWTKIP